MPLCGSSKFCGCSIVSTPAVEGAINGELPTIDVAGAGFGASPWNLTLNDGWADAVAVEINNRGVKGYASRTTAQTAITTVTDITSLTVTFTAATGRLYLITGVCLMLSSVANDIGMLRITNDLNTTQSYDQKVLATSDQGLRAHALVSPGAGSATYKLRAGRLSGSGNLTVSASASVPAFILVEDIGPA
jgi:hypothetical protein